MQATALRWALPRGVASITAVALIAALVLLALNWNTPVAPGIGYSAPLGFLVVPVNVVTFTTVGLLVLRRHPSNAIGAVFLAIGMLAATAFVGAQYAAYGLLTSPGSLPGARVGAWIYEVVEAGVTVMASTLVLLLFPDGRLPSRRWRPVVWLTVAVIAAQVFEVALYPGPLLLAPYTTNPFGVENVRDVFFLLSPFTGGLVVAAIVLSVVSLVVRYRDAGQTTRLQIKWIAYAGIIHALAFAIYFAAFISTGSGVEIVALGASTVPLATGIAILRYRLYDIDRLIDRTVVYGLTSASLAVGFVGAIAILQVILRPLTAGSELAIAASTLAAAAAVRPVRDRIQAAVDRRFYRERYDAQDALDAFVARMLGEVEIDTLRRDLLDVVQRTVRPTHASIWFRSQ